MTEAIDPTTMTFYQGTKQLKAFPLTRGEYNRYRGWNAPVDEDMGERGYLVEYQDGGKANDPRHAGYISWSPADVFEKTYLKAETYVDRLLIEVNGLGNNLAKLAVFTGTSVYAALPIEQQELLRKQLNLMSDYQLVLRQRIEIAQKT